MFLFQFKFFLSDCAHRDGKSVNIADYAAMCLRTSNHKAFLTGQGAKRKELGITTVLVSQHGTACPLCIPWQNEILIDDVFSGGKKEDGPYQLVSKAVSEGLLHVNCMHDLLTYIDGVTKRPKTIDPTATEERYKLKQDLRKLERGIRKQKRIVAGTVDIDNYNKEKIKLERLEKGYKDFLKEHKDFRGNDNRLKVEGLSNKDLKEHEKELLKPVIDDKIKEIRKYIKSDECMKKVHDGKQGKHVRGHNNYRGQSFLAEGVDPQRLVDVYHGTGNFKITDPTKSWGKKEFIMSDATIGYDVDPVSGEITPTRYFSIHYSKNGTHIVPRKEIVNGKFRGNEKS